MDSHGPFWENSGVPAMFKTSNVVWLLGLVLALSACTGSSQDDVTPADGDSELESTSESDDELAPSEADTESSERADEALSETADNDAPLETDELDAEQDPAETDPPLDGDESEAGGRDSDWDGKLETEAVLAEDVTAPYIVSKRLEIPFLKDLEAQNNATGGDHLDRWIVDSAGYLLTTKAGRLVAYHADFSESWRYPSASSASATSPIFIGQDRNRALYVYLVTQNENTLTYSHRIVVLDRASGQQTKEIALEALLGFQSVSALFASSEWSFTFLVEDEWLFISGPNLKRPTVGDPRSFWSLAMAVHLPDLTVEWERGFDNQSQSGQVAFAYPDGSYGFARSGGLYYERLSPSGKVLGSFNYVDQQGHQGASYAPSTMSNGTVMAAYGGGLWATTLEGTGRWRKDCQYPCVVRVDRDDSVLLVGSGNQIQHFAADGTPLYASGGFFDSLKSVLPLPAAAPWRWLAGSGVAVQLHTPYYGRPEEYSYQAVCQAMPAETTVIDYATPAREAEGEAWELTQAKTDATFSCPEAPALASPLDSTAHTAFSAATLDKVWVGNQDALWLYDLTQREARCVKLGKVDVVAGLARPSTTPLLAFAMGHTLYYGPAEGPFAESALPAQLGEALSLALDAEHLAVGGGEGLWLKTPSQTDWTKIETCCGKTPQVGPAGLFFDGGALFVGAAQGIWRVAPSEASCTLLCRAFSPDSSYEVYGRSSRGVWAGRKERTATQSLAQAPVQTLGECLDNGLWFSQTEAGLYYSAAADASGLVAMSMQTACQSPIPGVGECSYSDRLRSLPAPFGHSASLSVEHCAYGTSCPANLNNAQLVPTAAGYFLSSHFVEARRKPSVKRR